MNICTLVTGLATHSPTRRRRLLLALIAISSAAVGTGGPSLAIANEAAQSIDNTELHSIERTLIQRTNQQRARYGRPPLKLDFSLMRSARRHTAWMVRHRLMRHTTAPVAENIATGQRSSTQVINDWMNSPGHRANILNSSYRRIGVAAYRAPNGTVYWCQQFR